MPYENVQELQQALRQTQRTHAHFLWYFQ